MKVYFIPSDYEGCFYVRCLLPIVGNGYYGAKVSLRSPKESSEKMLQGAMASDIIVFQRPLQKEMLEAAIMLKNEYGKKIVMDNDDTYDSKGGLPKVMAEMVERQIDEKMDKMNNRLKEFAKLSDMVIVTTDFLAKEYKGLNKNVRVIPNMVDPDDWPIKINKNKGKQVRIGLVGSVAVNDDTKKIVRLLRELGKRTDVRLVVFGMPADSKANEQIRKFFAHEIAYWQTFNIEWHPAVPMADYFNKLNDLALDIMLIPRADNYFNRAKSNLKFLEASMLEIPVIAQGFEDGLSPYQGKEDSKHMLIAKDSEDWALMIGQLVNDKKYRRILGRNARRYVLKNYSIKKNAHLWDDAFKELLRDE